MDPLLKLALLVAFCPAPSAMVFYLVSRSRHTTRHAGSSTAGQARRRPAGESIRARLEELDQQIYAWLTYLAMCPAILALVAVLTRVPGVALAIGLFSGSILWTGLCAIKLHQLHQQRAEAELGFDGCRRVAEELNRLPAEGFEVYHDVPFDAFHIDHVLVGPPGVFAIETKTRLDRQRRATHPEVQFDGFRVNWPSESYGLEQTVSRARFLAQWLLEVLGQEIEVTPILTLPGWTVACVAPNPSALVLNPKEIGKLSELKLVHLNEELIRRVCHHLTQRCAVGWPMPARDP
ncbi:MAG TPA: nuclease-related domain-containing protein [Verrucomicrobiae bacterium]|nr:nuclease-related domain-containing protein [Verrucomicrobiae bacterium]